MRLNGAMCPLIFDGTLNKYIIAQYIKSCLKPTLSSDDVLLLDNSSVHTSKLVLDTLEECGIKHLFLPPYSPDFNPIELFWALMKSILRKLKARTHDKLEDAIKTVFDSVEIEFITNWFIHCGFVVNL
jgi:transposase